MKSRSLEVKIFLNKENKFVDNGLSKRIEHIDTLPRPAWHLIKCENYFNDFFTFGIAAYNFNFSTFSSVQLIINMLYLFCLKQQYTDIKLN